MFSWHAIPFARILLPFSIGVFISLLIPVYPELFWGLLLLLVLVYLVFTKLSKSTQFYKYQYFTALIVSLLLVVVGFLRTHYHDSQLRFNYYKNFDSADVMQICVDDAVTESEKFYKAYVNVERVRNQQWHSSSGQLLVFFNKENVNTKPKIGNRFIIKGLTQPIPPPSNPATFNYKQYLFYHNIHEQFFVKPNQIIALNQDKKSIYAHAQGLRDQCVRQLSLYIKDKEALGVSLALLLGYKEDLNPETMQSFSKTGTLHVLAVSGLHAGIVFMILNVLTSFLLRFKRGKQIQSLLVLLGIWYYAYVTGLSPSVCRASLMFSLMSVAKLSNRKTSSFNVVFMSAFILMLLNPYIIVDVGFQLSYTAVLGILYLQPKLQKLYLPKFKVDEYIWGLLTVSFAAQIFTFPLSIYYFHQFPLYFLLSNLLVIPIILVVLVMLIVLLVVSFYAPLAQLVAVVIQFVLKINGEVLRTIENLPYNSISGIYLSKLEMITLYAMVFISLAYVTYRRKWQMFILLLIVLFFQTNALYTKLKISEQKILTIHVIKNHDVVSCIEGSKMYLIADSGFIEDKKSFKFSIEPYCLEKGIKQIIWCNWENNYEFEHLKVISKGGFQFFDTKMTIIKNKILEPIYSDFCLLSSIKLQEKDFHLINCKYMLYSNLKESYNGYYLYRNKNLKTLFMDEYLIYPLNKK
jgi:competence protein ComEC